MHLGRNITGLMLCTHCIPLGGTLFSFVPYWCCLPQWLENTTEKRAYSPDFSTVKLSFPICHWWRGNLKLCKYTISYQIFHLFISLSVWTRGFPFHSMNYLIIQWIICYYTIYFDAPIVLDLTSRSLYKLTRPFNVVRIFLWLLPCFLNKRCSKLI